MPFLKPDSFENFRHPTNSPVRLEFLHGEGSLAWIKAFSAPSNMSVIKQSDREHKQTDRHPYNARFSKRNAGW
jgi:hypothetical protein